MERINKIRFKWLLSITSVIFLIVCVAVLFIIKEITFNKFKKEVSWATSIALSAADPEEVAAASAQLGDSFIEDAIVKRLKKELEGLGSLFLSKGVDAIYLMDKRGNDIYFLVESTPFGETGYVVPGSIYREAPDSLRGVFSAQKAVFTDLYTDEYGTYFSEFTPIINNGIMVGVIGVDIDNSYFNGILLRSRLIAFFLLLLIYISAIWNIYIHYKKDSIEAKVEDNDAKIKSIIDAVPSGIIAFNRDESIVFWNHACNDLFGLRSKEVLGKKIGQIISFEEVLDRSSGKKIEGFKFSLLEEYQNKRLEISILGSKKNILTIEVSFSIFESDGEKMFIGLFEDISDKKIREREIEEQKQRLERVNGLMIDRELKMLELKNELARIKDEKK